MDAESSIGPMKVLNIRLNCRGSVSSPPHSGHFLAANEEESNLSARKRDLHFLQSTRGSTNPATWPEASHTRGCIKIAASRPSTSSRSVMAFHQSSFTFLLSSIPKGP